RRCSERDSARREERLRRERSARDDLERRHAFPPREQARRDCTDEPPEQDARDRRRGRPCDTQQLHLPPSRARPAEPVAPAAEIAPRTRRRERREREEQARGLAADDEQPPG